MGRALILQPSDCRLQGFEGPGYVTRHEQAIEAAGRGGGGVDLAGGGALMTGQANGH